MDLFTQLFGGLLAFVYHCFDRIVIYGYLSGLSRPERVVNFFHQVVGVPVVSREILSQRSGDYQNWVEAFARNHRIPIEWAEKGVRKENHVLPWQRRMVRAENYGVYYILKSMEQRPSFRVTVPKYPTKGECQNFCVRGVSVSPPIGQVTVSRERPPRQARILADPCSLVRSKHLFLRPDLAFRRHRAQAWSNSPLAAGPEPRTAPAWGRAWRGPTI